MTEKTATILIAEDDRLVRTTTSRYLQKQGYQILEAANGEEALQLCKENSPDILLTDLRMPKLDGMALIRAVVVEYPAIPVVILSGLGTMTDVIEALRIGAWDYLTKPIADLNILNRCINNALQHAQIRRQEQSHQASLEKEVQQQTMELLRQNRLLEREMKERQAQEILVLQARQEWERTIDAMPDMVALVDRDHNIVRMNTSMMNTLGKSSEELHGANCCVCLHGRDTRPDSCPHSQLLKDGKTHKIEIFEERLGGHCEIITAPYHDAGGTLLGSILIARDINEQKNAAQEKEKLHAQLLHAQKLESVGQLAAGIAHEINTPTQFIGSNINFLEDVSQDIVLFMEQIQEIGQKASQETADLIEKALTTLDWEYLAKEMPLAISQSHEGVRRVTSIVRAMKEFSHPGSTNKESLNLNQIIETTVTVARNEWKYVADMELNLDPYLPQIQLLSDAMGQVILNMLVNAAHAIAEKLGENPQGDKGKITLSTRALKDNVELRLHDTGAGMPEEVRLRIFNPFFTTKKVGKGTGQGLAISHDVVVEKHQGTILVESTPGEGTTFIITLPLQEEKNHA